MSHRRLVIKERITAIIGAALLLALVGLSYYYSIQVELSGLKYVPSESSPDFTAENVTLTDFDASGAATNRLAAQSVAHFSDERMRALDARFYTLGADKPQMRARADEAWSDDGMETIELSGGVVLTQDASAEEPELEAKTEYLRGWLDTYRFDTDKPVFLRRGNDTTESERGMVYDNVAHTVEMYERIHTVLHPQNFEAPAPAAGTPEG